MPILSSNEKKRALLARKEELLREIKYYKKRIEDFRGKASSSTYFESSSDSEDDFPYKIDNGPSVDQLKTEQSMLRTCLQATQELTGLEVLQSEFNIMVESPVIEGEPPVTEPGSWREVTAECCIDLVHFSIMFYVHKANRDFAPLSFRGLKVLPAKTAHEAELAKSVLPGISRPSDAIEVLRSYAAAFRSRRTTLARLASKYAHNLFMEPMAEGGYVLKCADLLEVSWRLENKWSPVAPFHHRMKFDLEYIDESYIKIITQAHKQLSDPSIETDERTFLLSKIINTCLEAKGPTQELYESMESDPESVKNLKKRRTALDQETEAPIAKKNKAHEDKESEIASDDQIMAPPKSLPKKCKPKGKENIEQNRKSVKRSNVGEDSGEVKKAKTDKDAKNDVRQSVNDQNVAKSKIDKAKNDRKHIESNTKASTGQKNTQKDRADGSEKPKNVKKSKNNEDPINTVDDEGKPKSQTEKNYANEAGNAGKGQEKTKKTTHKTTESHKVSSKDKVIASSKNDLKTKAPEAERVNDKDKNMTNAKNNPKTKAPDAETVNDKDKNMANAKKYPKTKAPDAETVNDKDKNMENAKKYPKTKAPDAETVNDKDKNMENAKNYPKTNEDNTTKNKVKSKNALIQKQAPTDNAIKGKPETGKNLVKKTSNNNTKNLKAAVNSTNDNRKISEKEKENTKNLNKPEADTESLNKNKNSDIVNNAPKNKDAKKDASNKENAKTANIENVKANNDKNVAKNGANNNPDAKNAQKSVKQKNNEENPNKDLKNTEPKISNIQKSKIFVNPISIQNQINPKNSKVINTNNPKSATDKKITEKDSKHHKGDTAPTVINLKSVTTKTNEHIANRADTNNVAIVKKPDTKIGDAKSKNMQNKMAIKNLSHKNPSAQNKLAKTKITISGNTGGAIASNAAKISNNENGSTTKSKIPQKKLWKQNPLRISPRNIPSSFKTSSDSNLKRKVSQKNFTNIPRLMKKTASK